MNTLRLATTAAMLLAAQTAMAQAGSVQLYGSITAAVSHRTHQTGNSSVDEVSNSQLFNSFFGVRGIEDLGGGLNAQFRLEAALFPDVGQPGANAAGTGKFFNRQSYVGLGLGQAGTLSVGRQFHAAIDRAIQTLDVNNLAGSSLHSTPLALFAVNRFAGNDTRADNSLKYRINLPAGMTAGLSYGFGEAVGGNAGDSWSVDLGQTTASYALGAYAINFKSPTVIAASGKRPQYRALGVGGNVDVGLGRLYVHYMDSDADATTATGVSAVNKIWVLGWRVPVGKTSVKVAWTHDKARGLNGVAGRNGTKDTLALSAEYALSKRTSLHAAVFRNAYQDGYKLDPVNIAALSRDPNASSLQLYSVGVRHDF